jgi:thiol-disulfide isomerase/thioredoxin
MTRRSALAVGITLLVPVLIAGCGREQPPSALVGTDTVASAEREQPLALSGPTLDGDQFDLADLRGRVVVLNAWASWCTPCRVETPAFVALSEGSDPEDVVVVGLNVTDDAAAARAFVDEFSMPYPSIEDPDGALLATVPGVPPSSLPSTVILDRDGRIAARIIGGTGALELATLIAQVLEESPAPSALVSVG